MIKKTLVILIIFGIFLPSFSFAPIPNLMWGFARGDDSKKITQNLGEAEVMETRGLKVLPDTLKEAWQDSLRIIKQIWQKIKNFWNSYIGYRIEVWWQKILAIFGKEIEKRKEIIREEFPKEKKELKKQIPETSKSLWERFKELIK